MTDATRKTYSQIARELKVSQPSVSLIKYESLTDEQKAEVDKKRADLGAHGMELSFNALLKGKELVEKAHSVRDLPAVMGAAKIGHDISRLESNQPTVITQPLSDEDLALELFRRLIEKRGWRAEDAIEGIRERFPDVDVKLLVE